MQTLLSMKIISLFIYQTTKFLITIEPAIFCLFFAYLFFRNGIQKLRKLLLVLRCVSMSFSLLQLLYEFLKVLKHLNLINGQGRQEICFVLKYVCRPRVGFFGKCKSGFLYPKVEISTCRNLYFLYPKVEISTKTRKSGLLI